MWNPLPWVMEAAPLVAIALSNGGGPPDWQDFVGIVTLLLINSSIDFYEERGAGNAVKTLINSLAPKARVRHDGKWADIEPGQFVPGDMVAFKKEMSSPSTAVLPRPSTSRSISYRRVPPSVQEVWQPMFLVSRMRCFSNHDD